MSASQPPDIPSPSNWLTSWRKRGKIRFETGGITGLVLFFILLLALIFALFIISVIQAQRYARERVETIRTTPVDVGGAWVTFRYPRYLFLDGAAGELRINAWRSDMTSPPTQTLTLTLRFPAGIQVAGEGMNLNDEVAILTFPLAEESSTQVVLQLTNAGTIPNPRDLTVQATSNLGHAFAPLSIHIESPHTATKRTFWTEAVSDKGPVVVITTALLSIMAIFLQYFQRQQEHERLEARRLAQEVRNSLVKTDCRGVERAWNVMQIQGVISVLSDDVAEPLKDLIGLAFPLNRALSSLGEIKDLIKKYEDSPWCDNLFGALFCRFHGGFIDKDFTDLLLALPVHKIRDDALREKVVALWKNIPVRYQDRSPSSLYKDDQGERISDEKRRLRETTIGRGLQEEPLLIEKAEDEVATLFDKSGFWPGHSTYVSVMERIHADELKLHMVYGPSGCGCTALAMQIFDNLRIGAKYFPFYLSVSEDISTDELKRRMVHDLLKYICDKPTLLVYASERRKRLIARVLCQELGVEEVEDALDPTEIQTQSEVWCFIAQSQLTLLQQAVKGTDCETPLSETKLLNGIYQCFRTFGFEGLYFVLDFAAGSRTIDSIRQMVHCFQSWREYKIGATLLTHQVSYESLKDELKAFAPQLLSWSNEDLKAMLSHRFKILADVGDVEQFLDLEEFCNLCEPKTPRQVVRLWKKARLEARDADRIEEKHLTRAQNELRPT